MSSFEMTGVRSAVGTPRWGIAAAVGYSVVWVVGLLVWSSGLSVTASAGQVTAAYRGHETAALAQSTLVHGLAALALAVVVRALVAAVAVSVLQWLLGCALAAWAVPAGRAGAAGALYAGIALGSLAAVRHRVLPRWLAVLGAVLTVALVASAVAYLVGSAALAVTAYVSLPLLLVWVTGAGLRLARHGR